jgi:hypothetical protein
LFVFDGAIDRFNRELDFDKLSAPVICVPALIALSQGCGEITALRDELLPRY